MMKHLTTTLLLLLALGSNAALAAPTWQDRGSFITVAERSGVSLDQAVEQVREQTGGRILSAKTVREDGHKVHRIKVLTPDHKVRVIRIQAD